jgi:hypothetical protein
MSRLLVGKTGFLALASAIAAFSLTGCGLGDVAGPNSSDTQTGLISGRVHGGPNPVVNGRVVLYATTATGYGIGSAALATATTDLNGNWNFGSASYTCPANQYAYVVIYGGQTGSNASNPNSVLMTALGSCSNVSTSTFVWTDELTTIAAAYALNNFIGITGNASAGYTVGIGADGANSAAVGCVANSYYQSTQTCASTQAAGMAHAFSTANLLVNSTSGQVGSTTTNGAVIPTALINTLGNAIQACVNSNGGGTNGAGTPTTTTSAAGTTTDGTACGNLSAYTSYTLNGTATGTLVAAGNTLGYLVNLAKHPVGSLSTTFTNGGATVCSGTAASCIFALAPSQGAYQTAMSAAPPDFSLSIYYPKNSLSSVANTTTGCTGSPATLGLLYPWALATDINDNIDIVNGDASTTVCMNVISAAFDGSPVGVIQYDNTSALPNWIANDAFGHSIVPVHGSGSGTTNTNNGIRIYSTGADTNINLLSGSQYYNATANALQTPYFVTIDSSDSIWIGAQNGTNDFGVLKLNGSNSHTAPSYTFTALATATAKSVPMYTDVNNNVFFAGSSGSGGSRAYAIPAGTTTYTEAPAGDEGTATSSTSNGAALMPDTSGNVWEIATTNATDTQGIGVPTELWKAGYSIASGATTWGTSATTYLGNASGAVQSTNYKVEPGTIDGNNVMWWGDLQGQANVTTTPQSLYTAALHAFDTVNATYLPTVNGCAFQPAGSFAVTTSTIGASSTTFTVSNSAPPSVGSSLTLTNFPSSSSFYNGQPVTVTANTTASPITFTVASTFGQAAATDSDAGNAAFGAITHCGLQPGDPSYPGNTPYVFYGTRAVAVDSSGNVWTVSGAQGRLVETIGIAAPTWPLFIHNGTSNKP